MTERDDTNEMWRAHHKDRKRASNKRRGKAEQSFSALKSLAMQKGLAFAQHSDTHFALAYGKMGWLWNIYPGNRRIFVDEAHGATTPRLDVGYEWTLEDIVRAAIALTEEVRGR